VSRSSFTCPKYCVAPCSNVKRLGGRDHRGRRGHTATELESFTSVGVNRRFVKVSNRMIFGGASYSAFEPGVLWVLAVSRVLAIHSG